MKKQRTFLRALLSLLVLATVAATFIPFVGVERVAAADDAFSYNFDNRTTGTFGYYDNFVTKYLWQEARFGTVYLSDTAVTKNSTVNGKTATCVTTSAYAFPTTIQNASNPDSSIFQSIPPYYQIVDKGEGDKYIKIPFEGLMPNGRSGDCVYGNPDARLQIKNKSFTYTSTPVLAMEVDVLYHNADNVARVAECQFTNVKSNGTQKNYPTLFKLTLSNGSLYCCGTAVGGGTSTLTPDAWHKIKIVLNMEMATYDLYVDGVKSFTNGNLGQGTNTDPGYSNLTVNANTFVPVMCVCAGGVSAYTANSQSYVAVDNVAFYPKNDTYTVTVDGVDRQVVDGASAYLTKPGYWLDYATVEPYGEPAYNTSSTSITITKPTTITTHWGKADYFYQSFDGYAGTNTSLAAEGIQLKDYGSYSLTSDGYLRVPCVKVNNSNDPMMRNAEISYQNSRYAVIEETFRYAASSPTWMCRMISYNANTNDTYTYSTTANNTSNMQTVSPTDGSYLTLFTVTPSSGQITYGQNGQVTGRTTLSAGTTYNVKLFYDLQAGTVMAYVNGKLDAVLDSITGQYWLDKYLNGGSSKTNWVMPTGLYNISFPANKLAAVYCSTSATDETKYVDVDLIAAYSITEQEYVAAATMDFENYNVGATLSGTDFTGIPNAATYSIVEENGNKYLKVPFSKGSSTVAAGTATDSYVDQNLRLLAPAFDYRTSPVVIFEGDYYFSLGCRGGVQIQARTMTSQDANGSSATHNWVSFGYFLFKGNVGNEVETATMYEWGTAVDGAVGVKSGQWNHVRVVMNLITGTYDTYVNGEHFAYAGGLIQGDGNTAGYKNYNLPANSMIVAKLNKLNNAPIIGAHQFVDGTYFAVDNLALYADKTQTPTSDFYYEDFQGKPGLVTKNATAYGFSTSNIMNFTVETSTATDTTRGNSYLEMNCLSANVNKNWFVPHPAIATIASGRLLVVSVDYWWSSTAVDRFDIRFNGVLCQGETTHADFMTLGRVQPSTGKILYGQQSFDQTGSQTLNAGEWNNITFYIDMEGGSYIALVNGELDFSMTSIIGQYYSGGWKWTTAGVTNLSIPAGQFNPACICSGSNTNNADNIIRYDNIRMYETSNEILSNYLANVTLDGNTTTYTMGATVDLSKSGYQLISAVVTTPSGTYTTMATSITVTGNMTIVTRYTTGVAEQDFEDFATGKTLNGFTQVPNVYNVVQQNGNKYVNIPYAGTAAYSNTNNYDLSVILPNPLVSYDTDRYLVMEGDYRYHDTVAANGVFYIQWFTQNVYYNLFATINTSNGSLTEIGTKTADYHNLESDVWYNIKFIVDMVNGTYGCYLDDVLIANGYISASGDSQGLTNIVARANAICAVKVGKQGTWNSDGSETGVSIDVDNIKAYTTTPVTITVDGGSVSAFEGTKYQIPTDGTFLYATVDRAGGVYRTVSRFVDVEDGMIVTSSSLDFETLAGASTRLGTPSGLRYETILSKTDLADLLGQLTNGDLTSVKIGTIIAPTEYVRAVGAFTKEAFDANGKEYLDVEATIGEWFDEFTDYYDFAGSIVNIAESNYNRQYSGVGYIELILPDETVITCYGKYNETDHSRAVAYVAYKAHSDAAFYDEQNNATKALVESFSSHYDGLTGLHVLAIGDSLFGGHTLGREGQWLTLIGEQFGWALTNLGSNGWTVSYNPSLSTRSSLYDYVITKGTYVYDGNPNSVDYVFFEGGFNDYGMNIPVGTTSDRTESTFCGAWILMTEHLLETYPNAKIVFVTPWQINDARLAYTMQINTIYEELYEDNDRVLLLDAGDPAVSGINMNKTTYNGVASTLEAYSIWRDTYWDAYHLREEGMAHMKSVMTPLIQEIVKSQIDTRDYSALEGLNVLAIGDSLFAGDSTGRDKQWISLLANEYDWNYTSLANNGWALFYSEDAGLAWDTSDKLKSSSMSYALGHTSTYKYGDSSRYNLGSPSGNAADVDYILIEAGTNDYAHFSNAWKAAAPLGTVSDTTTDTFLGAMNWTIETLKQQYPNATVVLITPWHLATRNNTANRTGQAIGDHVVEPMTADAFTRSIVTLYETNYADDDRVVFIDAGSTGVSGIDMDDTDFRTAYSQGTSDKFHLNEWGQQMMRNMMKTYLYDIVTR